MTRPPIYQDDLVTLHWGDYRDYLPEIAAAQPTAVVTDPPYGETGRG